MKTSWPDPPPLFALAELEDPGEKSSWIPRPPKRRSAAPRPASQDPHPNGAPTPLIDADGRLAIDVPPLSSEEIRMAFDDLTAGFAPVAGRLFTRIAVFDLETTGVDTARDRIVTAYVGVLDETGRVLDERNWLADPSVEIPAAAAAVHGITTERAQAEGREARQVVGEIVEALGALFAAGIPVVAYNAPFDLSMLKNEAIRHGIAPIPDPSPVVDPLVLDKQHDRYRRGKRTLDIVAAHYGVPLDDAHEASADAIAAGRVAIAQASRYANDLPGSAIDLHRAQITWAAEQAESLSQYFVKIGKIAPGETIDGSWPIR
ncbi:3'-5' exonuclease [Microbacterium suaedae]|uniref:3'-5' exonuclease n=1 Tax=Microbacterium suaedae TaxID=2067813 RepID=UPI002FCD50E0